MHSVETRLSRGTLLWITSISQLMVKAHNHMLNTVLKRSACALDTVRVGRVAESSAVLFLWALHFFSSWGSSPSILLWGCTSEQFIHPPFCSGEKHYKIHSISPPFYSGDAHETNKSSTHPPHCVYLLLIHKHDVNHESTTLFLVSRIMHFGGLAWAGRFTVRHLKDSSANAFD